MTERNHARAPRSRAANLLGMLLAVLVCGLVNAPPARAASSLAISQVPLTIAIPQHPQVFIAVGNSESMDGDLGGAIMTGSGALGSGDTSLLTSSSPADFTIPSGFTPPKDPGSGGSAPYTVTSAGVEYDNGASRLNVAKAGISAVLDAYMANTDFALLDYATGSPSLYTTWVYYLSPSGGFSFSSAPLPTPPTGTRYIVNPCFHYTSSSTSPNVVTDCTAMAKKYGSSTLADNAYMLIASSSDDPSINDVLYAGSYLASVGVAFGGPSPSDPYTAYTLANYNAGQISSTYRYSQPGSVARTTSPTNAGFIPFSPEVMYARRGFGYGASQSATGGNVVVPLTSAGQQPTQSSVQTALNAFQAALAPETNQSGSHEIKASAGQSALPGLLSKINSYAGSVASDNSGCNPKQYAILVTDGLPTLDLAGNAWPPLGSAAASGYGVTATFNADGSLKQTNDQALTDTITELKDLKQAGITTYVVGLGAGVDPSKNPIAAQTLTAMAVAGGSGTYIAATSPQTLVDGLNQILVAIQAGSLSSSSAAVNSTGLNQGSVAYQASYTVSDTPYQDWTGNLRAFPIAASNGAVDTSVTPLWDAQALLDTEVAGNGWNDTRLVATWDPALNSGKGAGTAFRWSSLDSTQRADLQPSDTLGQDRVHYLRGDTTLEKHNGGPFRNRSHVLGDIVDSNPIYVGAPAGAYSDSSYRSFETTEASRSPMLYVGANDGMLHAIDPSTGKEQFAFVPNAVYPHLADLTDPLYNSRHRFYVDGSPQAGDVQFSDGTWHTVLVSGEGAGGNSVFALDVTEPQKLTTEAAVAKAALWEFSDADMGDSFSTPAIARVNASPGFAVFFGDGYNPPSNQAILYALNPQTGAVIAKINLCKQVASACDSSLPEGLSGVVAGNADGLLGDPVDHVYAGDLQGNLWSIDVSASDPTKWTVHVLFQARDSGGNRQPITTTPAIALNPNYPGTAGLMVFFGTGQLLGTSDLSSSQTQSFYGVLDDDPTSPYTRSDLEAQQLTTLAPGQGGNAGTTTVRTISNNCVNWSGASKPPADCPNDGQGTDPKWPTSAQKGWYVDLPGSGERVITDPRIDNGGVVFTTYAPSTDVCKPGGQSFLMDLAYGNGGSFSQPQFDINGDYAINSGDQVGSGKSASNPAGMSLGNVYAAAPTIISASLGNAHRVKLITKSDQTIQSVLERGGGASRVGWWQIQ